MYCFGPFSLDPARRLLLQDQHAVPVTARAFDVLLALLERAGETVSKDELMRTVWPDTVVEEANLSQHIFTLRKLLGQTEDHAYIATVPRRGYQFVAPVKISEATTSRHRVAAVSPPFPSPVRLEIPLDARAPLALASTPAIAVAPDGTTVVFVAADGHTTRLHVRRLDRFETTVLPGTEGATSPFFSPDGQWVGFESGRRLRKVPIDGGPPLALCELVDLRGAAWCANGDIVYAPGPTTGLFRVSASGGAIAPVTVLDFEGGERTHRWPHALPEGGDVIFTIGHEGATSFDEASLAIAPLDGGKHRLVLRHATDGRSVPDAGLVWARSGSVFAAAFNTATAQLEGPPRIIQRGVSSSATGVAHFACSRNGVLIHVAGDAETLSRSLVTIDRSGAETGRHAGGDSLEEPRLAPDGRTAVVSLRNRRSDLWSYDFTRGALGRLTFDGENFGAVWGPAADTITFSSSNGGASDLYVLRPDRSSPPELLVASEFDKVAGAWSPDGAALVFTEYHADTGADIWILDRHGDVARPFVHTRFNEYAPVFSPDGRHIAYVTDESGRSEVVVVGFPDATGKRQISTDGGTEPVWSRGTPELFYRSGDRLMRVDLSSGVADAGIPTTLFEGNLVAGTVTLANYDVTADGATFVMVRADSSPKPTALRVTIGWTAAGRLDSQ